MVASSHCFVFSCCRPKCWNGDWFAIGFAGAGHRLFPVLASHRKPGGSSVCSRPHRCGEECISWGSTQRHLGSNALSDFMYGCSFILLAPNFPSPAPLASPSFRRGGGTPPSCPCPSSRFPVFLAVMPPASPGIMECVGSSRPRTGKPTARRGRKATGLFSQTSERPPGRRMGDVLFVVYHSSRVGLREPYSPHSLAARPGVALHAPSQPKLANRLKGRGAKPRACLPPKGGKWPPGRRTAWLSMERNL